MGTKESPQAGGGSQSLPPAVLNTAALQFYARHFKTLVTANLVAMFIIAGMFAWHVFSERREVSREYFGVDFKTGRMVRVIPLNQPYLSNQSLLTRVQECIQQANTYDFVNFQRSFQTASSCFTDGGWNAFATELDRVGTLRAVQKQRLVAQAVATGVPVITGQPMERNGILTWVVQMPVRISFQGGEGGRGLATQNLLITATVQRVPEYENQYGIGIVSYIAEERRR